MVKNGAFVICQSARRTNKNIAVSSVYIYILEFLAKGIEVSHFPVF